MTRRRTDKHVEDPPRARSARGATFHAAGEELIVVSFPLAQRELPATLSAAEKEVLRLLLRGLSNQEIATERKTALRTVANQVASIFAKVRVRSRVELAARLAK
jgi:DNA-binding NarL/FixJ family response regulator